MILLLSADFFQKLFGKTSFIRTNVLLVLIWLETVYKVYQQKTKNVTGRYNVKYLSQNQKEQEKNVRNLRSFTLTIYDYILLKSLNKYSKTFVKRPLKKRENEGLNDKW